MKMENYRFALVEKILKDVDNILKRNCELCSFEIVPVDSNIQNKSPVLLIENSLGLESWCIKHVYMYCYSEIMDNYFNKSKRKALNVSVVNSERLTKLLNITLLLNPDLYSLWNKRRELVVKSILNNLSELKFSKLVLSRKPKCNEAFSYRRWILNAILKEKSILGSSIESLLNEELKICESTSIDSPNNYHSWNHRLWVIHRAKEIEDKFDSNYIYIKEYKFSERSISKSVSDHSSFHYRQFCVRNIFNLSKETWKTFESTVDSNLRKEFVRTVVSNLPKDLTIEASEHDLISYTEENLVKLLLNRANRNCSCFIDYFVVCRKLEVLFHELVLNDELLRFYTHHETLWYHRRFVIHEILILMYDHFGLTRQNGMLVKICCRNCSDTIEGQKQKMVRYDSNYIYKNLLFIVLVNHEKIFVDERKNLSDNYAERHEKYLKFVEGLNCIV